MILKAWRLLRLLSLREYMGTIFTVLLPVLPISLFNLSVIWILLTYVVWCPFALLLIASMLKEQKGSVEQRVDTGIDEVLSQLRELENKYDENAVRIAGLEEQVDEVDRVMRTAFEESGVALPGRSYAVRAGVSGFSLQVSSPTVELGGGSRMARLRRWGNRQVQRIKVCVWGE